MFVVSLYLLYTIYEADYELLRAGDFYADLGVPHSASEREIKSRFRRLAAVHHPDKQGSDGAGDAAAYFIHLKAAADALVDGPKRFAYDRFGPEVIGWQHCSSIGDYVWRGVMSRIMPHYLIGAAAMYGFGLLGYANWGKYYRWLVMLALCILELHVVTRPQPPTFLSSVLNPLLARATTHPPYLQFQLISLLRKLCITLYIAFNQIGPLLNRRGQAEQRNADNDEAALAEGLMRLENMTRSLNTEAERMLTMEMSPFKGDDELVANVGGKVKEWLVQNTIRNDPMVRDAVGNSIRRRRVDAPAGAKGNR
jgi:hypothetical protein